MNILFRAYCEGIDIRFDSDLSHTNKFTILKSRLYEATSRIPTDSNK